MGRAYSLVASHPASCELFGVCRRFQLLEGRVSDAVLLPILEVEVPPFEFEDAKAFGLHGGAPGSVGDQWIEHPDGRVERLKAADKREMAAGDIFVVQTPAGGGFGKP